MLKKIILIVLLSLLTISAFCVRLENYKNSQARSIDEVVYMRLAKQIKDDIHNYNSIAYGEELQATGRELPNYFFQPLFKHPPLFALILSWSMHIFGVNGLAGGYVTVALGALMIPLMFFLGTLAYNWRVGLMCSVLMWLDPISIICSQKVWMDTPLGFFALLSILLFSYGLKKDKDKWYLASGFVSGLGTLTKYSGFLSTLVVLGYALVYRRDLFKNKLFVGSLFLPFLMLMPWFFWNYKVYGLDFFSNFLIEQFPHFYHNAKIFGPFVLFAMALISYCIYVISRKKHRTPQNITVKEVKKLSLEKPLQMIFTALLIVILWEPLRYGLEISYLPQHSWAGTGFPADISPFFYFRQLVNFSMIYSFGLLGMFVVFKEDNEVQYLIRFSAILIIAFFIVWKNYQSRYIMPFMPMLIVLTCGTLYRFYEKILTFRILLLKQLSFLLLSFLICLAFAKLSVIHSVLSFPHNFCYF